MKKMKKIDPKATEKTTVMNVVRDALANAGYDVADGTDYGMTKGTLVVHGNVCDVQVKPITPKAGVDRYEIEDDDE